MDCRQWEVCCTLITIFFKHHFDLKIITGNDFPNLDSDESINHSRAALPSTWGKAEHRECQLLCWAAPRQAALPAQQSPRILEFISSDHNDTASQLDHTALCITAKAKSSLSGRQKKASRRVFILPRSTHQTAHRPGRN